MDPLVEAGIAALHRRSRALGDFFLTCLEERCPDLAAQLVSPRDCGRRGGHLTLRTPDAGEVERRLAERGVIVDSRPPELLRLAFAPLYVTYGQVWQAVQELDDATRGLR